MQDALMKVIASEMSTENVYSLIGRAANEGKRQKSPGRGAEAGINEENQVQNKPFLSTGTEGQEPVSGSLNKGQGPFL